jgi:hypothetical protein
MHVGGQRAGRKGPQNGEQEQARSSRGSKQKERNVGTNHQPKEAVNLGQQHTHIKAPYTAISSRYATQIDALCQGVSLCSPETPPALVCVGSHPRRTLLL